MTDDRFWDGWTPRKVPLSNWWCQECSKDLKIEECFTIAGFNGRVLCEPCADKTLADRIEGFSESGRSGG